MKEIVDLSRTRKRLGVSYEISKNKFSIALINYPNCASKISEPEQGITVAGNKYVICQ